MSSQFTPAISQMSPMANANVDMSNSHDITQMFKYLLNTVETLQNQVTTQGEILNELSALRSENATLKAEIANLNAQMKSAHFDPVSKASKVNSASTPATQSDQKTEPVPPTTIPSYAAAAIRGATSRPATKKRKLAACRAFMPVDLSAPRGFEYLYLNRTRKLSRAEVRRNLCLLGLNLSHLLDICFPGPKVIGFLVHAQCFV